MTWKLPVKIKKHQKLKFANLEANNNYVNKRGTKFDQHKAVTKFLLAIIFLNYRPELFSKYLNRSNSNIQCHGDGSQMMSRP